ncbi:hypothetical protein LPJ53_004983 [Coemansia erecta]|uniref:Smr domain-containing protein n=1 Tax=Coemansia erecta TaxID=147472 RepID=A0A9W7XTC3_9FUNG|nr:hypothetical protein LPJ53_004983 [Coemansia erecta]
MITLASLISDYGDYVDRNLITSIWAEQNQDQLKCRNIIHMLSGQPDPKNHFVPTPTASECISAGHSDIFSQGSSPSEHSSQSGHTVPRMRSQSRSPTSRPDAIKSPAALVAFLAACFPECGYDYLETRAKEIFTTQDQGVFQVDPVEAIDIISNALYNDLETIEMQEYMQTHDLPGLGYDVKDCSGNGLNGHMSTSLSAIEAQYSVGAAQPKANKGKKGKGNWNGARPAGARNKRASSMPQPANRAPANAWGEISNELDAICAMFPMLSVGTVKATFHKCGANVDQTVESLSSQVASRAPDKPRTGAGRGTSDQRRKPDPPPSPPAIARTYATLQMMFPDSSTEILEVAAQKTTDINNAIDLVLRLTSEAQSASRSRTDKMGVKWQRADELSSHRIASSAIIGTGDQIDKTDSAQAHDVFERIPLADLSGDARIWVSEHNVDPAYCRKRAEELITKRNEFYAKAAMAYSVRKSQKNHSGTALYYSTEGHKYDARARVWRMRAAQAVVASGRQNDSNVIDLHGLSRIEAVAVALEEVNSWYVRLLDQRDYSVKNPVTPLHIVTGIGNRSANSKAIIHPAIVKALREDGWWFEENPGYVDVLGIKQGGARVRVK